MSWAGFSFLLPPSPPFIEELRMNGEGYKDPTADKAVRHLDRTPEHIVDVIIALKMVAGLAGYDIVGRIHLRDRETGKEYR